MKNKLLQRIEVNDKILRGKPIIKGTRISVELILKCLSQGMSVEEICQGYEITPDDVKAAILYAEKVIEGETIFI